MLMSSIYNSSTKLNSLLTSSTSPTVTSTSPNVMKFSSIINDGYPYTMLSSLPSSPTSDSTDSSPEPS